MRSIILLAALASSPCLATNEARQYYSSNTPSAASGIAWQTAQPSSAVNYASSNNYNPQPSSGYAPSYIQWTTASAPPSPSSSACFSSCQNYQSILLGCQHDAGQYNVYKSCVCNDVNFQSYSQECVDCEGAGSAPAQFQQNCKGVVPDCSIACSLFGDILSGCGDPSSSGYEACVCGGAYDPTYTTTFNQAFNDCVVCENGGGHAAEWEQKCCAAGYGCNGLPSGLAPSGPTPSGPSHTNPGPMQSSTSSGFAMGKMDGLGWTHLLAGFALGLV